MSDLFERFGPVAAAACMVAALYFFRTDLTYAAASKSFDLSNVYSSVFDWSSIQTGFVFGIFGFVAGKSGGFIEAIRETREMALFLTYTKRAIYLGFCLTFSSIAMSITSFNIDAEASWRFHVFAAWSFLSLWGFLAFLRVAYIFGDILRVRDRHRIPG
ncbi:MULTISPECIES: hypothetical protein [unclassified Rhizobium]|uniref:hypothetical protein n=1 Tax=unclassified Rhizobium TaxID=2613769 RepID=UPI001B33734D|nr:MULTISPECIES: hypothetical protein [unclassified Rhizobium]MBX5256033.1 hypothetical protein [Rhizobium sp. NLR16b]MBX5262128.1 hypothetical protein [Rhizobium sp. NLR16a]MBX5310694.1 hypothetical protein [Rhizobium sp. NLR11b]QTU98343.1 hypothetical protein J7U39_09345 [Rhizobium sp. NLR16a]